MSYDTFTQHQPQMWRRIILVALWALFLLPPHITHAQTEKTPRNHLVVAIDTTISYQARLTEALNRSLDLLDQMKQAKAHRWQDASAFITIITVDALPEVLWQGSSKDLKTLDSEALVARVKARTDYEKCTDVNAAFTLAAQQFAGHAQGNNYLWMFSDLVNEPPTTSLTACAKAKRPSPPAANFPWETFKDVEVKVFWLPPEQKLAWQRAVAAHGLTGTFALYTESESATVTISPPKQAPRATLTETDAQATRDRMKGYGKVVVQWLALGFLVLMCLVASMLGFARWRRARAASVAGVRMTPVSTPQPSSPFAPLPQNTNGVRRSPMPPPQH